MKGWQMLNVAFYMGHLHSAVQYCNSPWPAMSSFMLFLIYRDTSTVTPLPWCVYCDMSIMTCLPWHVYRDASAPLRDLFSDSAKYLKIIQQTHPAPHRTMHTILYPTYCTLHTPHCTFYTLQGALYTQQSALHTPQCVLHTQHCVLHTPNCLLQTPHYVNCITNCTPSKLTPSVVSQYHSVIASCL